MRIGAHVSTSGGPSTAFDRSSAIGAEAVQIFGQSPHAWAFRYPAPDAIAAFRKRAQETGIAPTFIHAIYLINLGTGDPAMLVKSVQTLQTTMKFAADIGAAGVVFHGGSHKGAGYEGIFRQTVDSLAKVLDASPPGPMLCIENSAGMGNHIGSKFGEIGRIIKAVGSTRLKVCLDTQHSFAAGYNLADPDGINAALLEFDQTIGLQHLAVVHANDSKTPLASGVDRHANIG